MKEADTLAEIIKHVDELPIDNIDKAMLLKAAASYFDGRAQAATMREILYKAVLQATMPNDIKLSS